MDIQIIECLYCEYPKKVKVYIVNIQKGKSLFCGYPKSESILRISKKLNVSIQYIQNSGCLSCECPLIECIHKLNARNVDVHVPVGYSDIFTHT